MYDLEEILQNVRDNAERARKLFEVERKILSIDNFEALFEELLILIEDTFHIPHVWISVIAHSDLSQLLPTLETSELLRMHLNIVTRDELLELLNDSDGPLLVNENLRPFYRLFPAIQKFFVKSLAIAPLSLDGALIGSLNLGDASAERFEPDMDTFFLDQLAVKISICLSNVTAREKLRQLATRDPLTNLLNRRELERILHQELQRAKRYGHPVSVIFLDCDDFKKVNDRHGHDCGDAYLCHVASELARCVRSTDIVFRFAGDEFVILLPNQSLIEARAACERIGIHLQRHPMPYLEESIPVALSAGAASTEEREARGGTNLLHLADLRLYEVKKRRRRQDEA